MPIPHKENKMNAEQQSFDHCFVIFDPVCGKIAGVATTKAIADFILAEYIKTIPVDEEEDMPIILYVPFNQRLEGLENDEFLCQ